MNSSKAKAIMKYVEANIGIVDKLNKGLKEIKDMVTEDKESLHIFRNLGLTCVMFRVLNIKDERVQKWVLSIFTSCLLEKEFREEVFTHENGIPLLVTIFRTTKCKTIQHRLCRVIGQQSYHDQSCSAFHNWNILHSVISFLKESKSDEEKESAIKTLRCLSNSSLHCYLLLKENGLYFICLHGLASPTENLRKESLKLILHFNKNPNYLYFRQLMRGTDNLQVLSKLYETSEDGDKRLIRCIMLTLFWHHTSSSSSQEYNTNCLVLDNLCMAKLPHMIVSELEEKKTQEILSKDDVDLILALCKFCELDIQWEQFALNVLPLYHERIWMQLTDLQGIPLLVSFLASHRHDLSLLQALLKGLLGVEYLHCNRVKVLYYCLEARLLPLLDEIFDQALKEILKTKPSKKTDCHHFLKAATPSKRKFFSKEISKDLLDLVEQSHSSNAFTISTQVSLSPPKPPPPAITVAYKSMNKIKFRTGKRGRNSSEDRKRCCNGQEEFPTKEDKLNSSRRPSGNLFSALDEIPHERFNKTEEKIDANTQNWLNVLEYIIRLLYQVVSVKKDISSICRQFLPKVYHYICESCVVHSSALKLLAAIARNSTSIQFTLDIMLIPKLRVDLAEDGEESCSQCSLILKGVNDFLGEAQSFYNHYHQYGRCEVANRLHPSKPDIVKYSCIVAVAHVVRCPSLLTTFFLNHKGLETLMLIFNQPFNDESKLQLYAVASLCGVAYNLKREYQNKNKNTCVFCTTNLCSVASFSKKEHIIQLTSLHDTVSSSAADVCKIKEERERDFTFRLKDKDVIVNKDKMSLKNDVFRAMLQGSFSESTENCICLRDVDSVAMEMVIHYIYGCTCDIFYDKNVNIYYDLLSLSEMYFVPELQVLAIHHLSKLLNPDDIFPLIQGLANYVGKDLLEHLICSLMSQSTSFRTQEKWISQALASSLKDVVVPCIMDGLTRVLESMSSLCNCDIYRTY